METALKLNFMPLKAAVAAQWEVLQRQAMFRVDVDKDELWTAYQNAFPEGTNPIYRERREHDCSCCKQFIRAVGDAVAIVDGKLVSVWDVVVKAEPVYTDVAKALSTYVKSKPIKDFFLSPEKTAGTDRNFEQLTEGQKTWNHFFVNIGRAHVEDKLAIPTKLNELRTGQQVFLRALNELTEDALETVLELIGQNSIYRGTEFKFQVAEFQKLKREFSRLDTDEKKAMFAWTNVKDAPKPVTGIRNTAIGTLLVNLSDDMPLEDAVKVFETSVMAPSNYKRPTALVSKAQVEKAKVTLSELGLLSALDRRFANINDITVNNVLFRDRSVKEIMGDVFDTLSTKTVSKAKTLDKVEEVPVERFLAEILPRAESIEVLLENRHASNFVSLIAPVDPTAGKLFKWDNDFSWSYSGEMADSIKERVKKAGGSVVGDLCCRLAWDYEDDLDFHMQEPGGHRIYFSNRRQKSPNGGMLDLDANGTDGPKAEPAENIFYSDKRTMREGIYLLAVNNYSRRSDGRGFEVEIEFDGETHNISYDKVLRSSETVVVAKIQYSKVNGFSIIESLPSSAHAKTVWGIQTQNYHKVSVMMMSPNFWDGQLGIGNKHFFFMIDGCRNDGTARGFFNEHLRAELTEHRKVLEMVGGKMKVPDSTDQLSGLGFSSTKKETLVARVKGSFSRTIKIVF